jgi:hypothetical protein
MVEQSRFAIGANLHKRRLLRADEGEEYVALNCHPERSVLLRLFLFGQARPKADSETQRETVSPDISDGYRPAAIRERHARSGGLRSCL